MQELDNSLPLFLLLAPEFIVKNNSSLFLIPNNHILPFLVPTSISINKCNINAVKGFPFLSDLFTAYNNKIFANGNYPFPIINIWEVHIWINIYFSYHISYLYLDYTITSAFYCKTQLPIHVKESKEKKGLHSCLF